MTMEWTVTEIRGSGCRFLQKAAVSGVAEWYQEELENQGYKDAAGSDTRHSPRSPASAVKSVGIEILRPIRWRITVT
ncbi:MAG: hypothetical protein ACLR8P_02850 [Clostridium fessum]